MRKQHQTLMSIEYAFGSSIIASFSVLGIAGFLFGFQLGQWTEWQGILVGSVVTIATVVGTVLGLRMSVAKMRLRNHSHHRSHPAR